MQLVSDSVKAKQAYNTLLTQKQALAKQLQQLNTSIENSKARIAHSEEQVQLSPLPDPSPLHWSLFFSNIFVNYAEQICCSSSCLLFY